MTTIHSTSQAAPAPRDLPGNRGAALNRLDDKGDRVMFEEPDSLADYEWPPVELVLDHYEACLGGGPPRRCAGSGCVDRPRQSARYAATTE